MVPDRVEQLSSSGKTLIATERFAKNLSMDQYLFPSTSSISRHKDSYPAISPSIHDAPLRGRSILITGAGRGIGSATALAFAASGANVACLSRTLSDLESVIARIEAQDEELNKTIRGQPLKTRPLAIVGDVTDPACPKRAILEAEDKLGPIDILINNAGTSRISTVEYEEDFEIPWKVIETNLRGSLAFTHAVVPYMVKRERGIIINVVSALAVTSPPYFSAYSSAKAGLIRATHIMDQELKSKGILTFALHPGMVAETTLGVGALNETAMSKDRDLKGFMEDFVPSMEDTLSLPADTMVALCVREDANLLSGRYVNACQDLGEVLEKAKRWETNGEGADLYRLKVDML